MSVELIIAIIVTVVGASTPILIAAMGGRLTVESKPGEGSLFTIILPAAEAAPEPQRKSA